MNEFDCRSSLRLAYVQCPFPGTTKTYGSWRESQNGKGDDLITARVGAVLLVANMRAQTRFQTKIPDRAIHPACVILRHLKESNGTMDAFPPSQ